MKMNIWLSIALLFLWCSTFVNGLPEEEDKGDYYSDKDGSVEKRGLFSARSGCFRDIYGNLLCVEKYGAIVKEGEIGGKKGCVKGKNGELICGGKDKAAKGKEEEEEARKRDVFGIEDGCFRDRYGGLICDKKGSGFGKGGAVGGRKGCIRDRNGELICGGKVIGVGRKEDDEEEDSSLHS